MTGWKLGLVKWAKQGAPHITATHCMIHHETWAANYMNESPASVFSTCIKIVNFIKGTVKTLFA